MLRLELGFKLVCVRVMVRVSFKLGFRFRDRVTIEDKVWVSDRFRVSIRIWL